MNHPLMLIRWLFTFSCLLFLCLIVLSPDPTAAQTAIVSRYAYLTESAPSQLQLHLINPANSNERIAPIPITLTAGYSLRVANPSPDGRWLAVWSGNLATTTMLLQLYQMSTGTWQTILQIPTYQYRDVDDLIPVWSPNSQYLAFITIDGTAFSAQLFMIASQTLTTVRAGTAVGSLPFIYPIELAWSQHSTRLAIVESNCYNQLCTNDIRPFAIPSLTALGEIRIDGTICNLKWSPDNRRISFIRDCDYNAALYLSDIFIWEVGQQQAARLTHFTNQLGGTWTQTFVTASLDVLWYDANQLLIGIAAMKTGSLANLYTAETALYHSTAGRVAELSDEIAYGWVRNPFLDEITYRSLGVTSTNEKGFDFSPGSIRIATFDGTNLVVTAQVPGPRPNWGKLEQSLYWSPDGRWVAYSQANPPSYFFLDKITATTTQFLLPENGYSPLGWVSVQQTTATPAA